MFKFLVFVFLIFLLLVFLFGFSIVRFMGRFLFGIGSGRRDQTGRQQNQQSKGSGQQSSAQKRHKVFSSNDGEYIDYEEIKD
ncbi:MAG: DUF4834 family protein [Tannerellaceae bacterium]|jgi:hypothetical protein|nr:DUF4834 family protein [Tannerellaceae bacterium]